MGPEWGWPQVGQVPDSVAASQPLTVYNQTPCSPRSPLAPTANVRTSPGFQFSPIQHSLATEAQPESPPTPHRSAPDIYPWTESRPPSTASCPSPLQVAVTRHLPQPPRSARKSRPALEALTGAGGGPRGPAAPRLHGRRNGRKLQREAGGGAAEARGRGAQWVSRCHGRNSDAEDRSIDNLLRGPVGGGGAEVCPGCPVRVRTTWAMSPHRWLPGQGLMCCGCQG